MIHFLIDSASSFPSSIILRKSDAEAVGVGPFPFFLVAPFDDFTTGVPLFAVLDGVFAGFLVDLDEEGLLLVWPEEETATATACAGADSKAVPPDEPPPPEFDVARPVPPDRFNPPTPGALGPT